MRALRIFLFLLITGILITIACYDMIAYEFTEQFIAANLVFSKLLPFVIIITIGFSIWIIRYGYRKGRLLKSKTIDYFKAIGLFVIALGGIGLLTFGILQGAVLTANRTFGMQKDILINGIVTDFKEMHDRKKVHYYIKVADPQIDRAISLRVKSIYKVGDNFKMNMKMGCLDLLYKK
jgi:hypothetical protein